MFNRKLLLRERGDTIIEVLIAIAVVGSVLGITYSIMSRNLLAMRNNQERTEATKYAQGQIEALKSLWGSATGQQELNDVGADGFCVNADGGIVELNGGAPHVSSAGDGVDFAGYHPDDPQESSCQFAELYHVGLRREVLSPTNTRYKVYVRWDRIGGGERNETVITYRLE